MAVHTPNFGFRVPSGATKVKALGSELQTFGNDVDAILAGFDMMGADPDLIVSRLVQLETTAADLTGRVESLETVNRHDVVAAPVTSMTWGTPADGWIWTLKTFVPFPAGKFATAPAVATPSAWAPNRIVFGMIGEPPTKDGFEIRFMARYALPSPPTVYLSYSAVETL